MEIKITTQQVLKVLYVISWIIFLGLCVEAGGILFNTIFTLLDQPLGEHNFWQGADLSSLYSYDNGRFVVIAAYMVIIAVLKAILFYLIVKILHDKKLNMVQPFNSAVSNFIAMMSYLSIGIGLFSLWGANYSEWLVKQSIKMPDIAQLNFDGADVWLFMGIVLLVIAQIFKRGIEIQDEHELTV
jgi:hypothetical protein